jgi:hypothetical protein
MKTKREEAVIEIINTFEEMSDIVLNQLTLLEKYMAKTSDEEHIQIASKIRENEDKIDRFEVLVSEKFINLIILYQPVASDKKNNCN